MAGYIGKVQIAELGLSGDPVLIGSTLYGICRSSIGAAAKTVIGGENGDDNSGKFINNNYDNLVQGTTIHVKFINGNSATSNVTLQVGTTNQAKPVDGRFVCEAGTIISFTFDENEHWVVNDNIDTNTEYVFAGNTPYNASTNKALAESSVSAAAHKGIVTDIANNSSSDDLPTTAAVASYVQNMTGGLAGLTGAMHFRGIATVEINDGDGPSVNPTITGYTFNGNGDNAGDVVLWNGKEFVWTGLTWEELGDEGSWAFSNDVLHISGAKGDIIYWSEVNSPIHLTAGTNGQFLKLVNGVPTWAADNNDNTKVTQAYSTSTSSYPLLFSDTAGITSTDSRGDKTALVNNAIYVVPETGEIHATKFYGNGSELTNITASSIAWTNVTNKILGLYVNTTAAGINNDTAATTNSDTYIHLYDGSAYSTVKLTGAGGASVSSAENSKTITITSKKYKSTGSADALTSLTLTYNNGTAQTNPVSSTAVAIGSVENAVLYIKSIKYDTTSVSTGVSEDNT